MLIAGFQKTSYVDYPGKIAAVVFTPGCNMRCVYCHNRHIISGEVRLYESAEVFGYLEKRGDVIDAVVVSGGEPTLQKDLREFIVAVREMGFLTKLDTNGTNPARLAALINEGLLDYVAMDIKAPLEDYSRITRTRDDISAIRQSMTLLMNSGVDYEFRTTFAPQLAREDILKIAGEITGAKRYCLQQYRKTEPSDREPHPSSLVTGTAKECGAQVRGV